MRTVHGVSELRAAVAELRRAGATIGFVPTMGNLHDGHYALVDLARARAGFVITSIFVNPTQFGPGEDFAAYPRTLADDAAGLAAHGCDLLFVPTAEAVYPNGIDRHTQVVVPQLGDVLDGVSRPGHFAGVAMVVAKLFNLVQPDLAVFGQKDFQQLLVVRRMTRDLAFPIEIVTGPIVREASGLAMSSRNRYLSGAEREQAAAIYATLRWMAGQIRDGVALPEVEAGAFGRLKSEGLGPEYAVIRRAEDLGEPDPSERRGLVALIAARLGRARLIDNILIGND
jgi:pantoate--beta-alanine ligase